MSGHGRLAQRQEGERAMKRNRYADLLRAAAIVLVVLGHWLLTSITFSGGRLSGVDALNYVLWGRWVTWVFQVMPVFFVVGGYVNAESWRSHHTAGVGWAEWVRGRALRLLWPTSVYVACGLCAVSVARAAGVPAGELGQAGWLVALHLWFLPAYLLLIALTPVMLELHRRFGLYVPAAMAGGAGLVDVLIVGPRLPVIGFANYLLVWGSTHQWGFAWLDGALTRQRWRPWALLAAGAIGYALLTWLGPFPVDMIAGGERTGNTTPPSVALLAFAAAQTGLLLAVAGPAERWLNGAGGGAGRRAGARLGERAWRVVRAVNPVVLIMYLWHMVPAIIVAMTLFPTGVLPAAAPVASRGWWAARPAWFGSLIVVLAGLTIVLRWAMRPLLRLPAGIGRDRGTLSAVLLGAGIVVAMVGLARLAIGGFAPGGQPAVLPAVLLAAGVLLAFCSGGPTANRGPVADQPRMATV